MAASLGRCGRDVSQRLQRYKLILFEPNSDLIRSGSGLDRITRSKKKQQKHPLFGRVGGLNRRVAADFFSFI